ncbi:MAG: ankyrin repeat domain-containing protein [bacterium]|jgi:ankyrin repeat protein
MRALFPALVFVLCTPLAALAQGSKAAQAPQVEPPEAQLFRAIREGKGVFAEGLVVEKRVNVNARDANGEAPLHRAVERGMPRLSKLLIDAGANVRARSKHGETPLHLAALHADPILAELLLAAGADANARNDAGESVLYWAALTGNTETVRVLIERGADPDITDLKGNGPLHGAADGGHEETIRLLVKYAAEPRGRNRAGQTPGDLARARGYKTIAQIVDDAVPGEPPGSSPGFRTLYDDDKPAPVSPRRR